MEKIKICHVIGNFVNGGVESVIYNYFSHMNLENFEVSIIGHGIRVQACANRFNALGLKIYNITPKSESLARNLKEMKEIFDTHHFDIIHSHLTEWACVPMILGWLSGVKVRINHSHMSEKPRGLKNKIYYGTRLFLGKAFATDYFACGRDAGIYLFGKRAVESGKVKLIPNAIDFDQFQYNPVLRSEVRASAGIQEQTIVLGHVGRFFEQKNHRFLLEVFRIYHTHHPDSILLLFGDGELKNEIAEMVHRDGLGDCVRFMGVRSDIARWYKAMDVFVLPSFYEGFPVVGVEAQASGLPCLFANSITREIAISPYADFLPLEQGAEAWADRIDLIRGFAVRENAVLDQNHYDIMKNAGRLERFYIKRRKGRTG